MKKLLLLLTLAFSIGCLFMVTSVTEAKTAASTKKTPHAKMVTAYREFLKKHRNHSSKFAMVYLDNNNIPEMFFVETVKGKPTMYLYTYKKGKVTKVKYFNKRDSKEANKEKPDLRYLPKKSVYYLMNKDGEFEKEKKNFLYGKNLWPNTNKKCADSSLVGFIQGRIENGRRVGDYYTFKSPNRPVSMRMYHMTLSKYFNVDTTKTLITFYPNTDKNAKTYIK